MPTIDVDYAEFERMLGKVLNRDLEKVNDVLAFAKGEVKLFDEKTGMMSVGGQGYEPGGPVEH